MVYARILDTKNTLYIYVTMGGRGREKREGREGREREGGGEGG